MSPDEQNAAIGRLALERADLRKHRALIESEAARIIHKVHESASDFLYYGLSFDRPKALSGLEAAIELGGLEKLNELISERERISGQLSEVEGRASLVGI
jgi:hypothetical protein